MIIPNDSYVWLFFRWFETTNSLIWTPTCASLYFPAHQYIKNQQIPCVSSLFGKNSNKLCSVFLEWGNSFSNLVSWHLMVHSLRQLKPLYWYWPWIYPFSTLQVDFISTLLVLAVFTRKDPMLLEYVGQQWATLEAEVWNMIAAFSLGKKSWFWMNCQNRTNSKKIRAFKKKHNLNENRLNHFCLNKTKIQGIPWNASFSRTNPYKTHTFPQRGP